MKNGCANRMQSQACLSYAEVQPGIDEVNGLRDNGPRDNGLRMPLGAWASRPLPVEKAYVFNSFNSLNSFNSPKI